MGTALGAEQGDGSKLDNIVEYDAEPLTDLHATSFSCPAEYAAGVAEFLRSDDRMRALAGRRWRTLEESAAALSDLQRILFDEAWSRLGWPEAAGGLGGDPRF